MADLSNRERRVIELAAQGYSNREIATRLGLSVRTIRNHLKSAYKKYNVNKSGRGGHKGQRVAGITKAMVQGDVDLEEAGDTVQLRGLLGWGLDLLRGGGE